jgi:hypothetical protein
MGRFQITTGGAFCDTGSGNDANSGLTALLPKKTIASMVGLTYGGGLSYGVLLSGWYTQASGMLLITKQIWCDGLVVIDGNGIATLVFGNDVLLNLGTYYVYGKSGLLKIQNFIYVSQGRTNRLYNTFLKNIPAFDIANGGSLYYSIAINVGSGATSNIPTHVGNIVFNSSFTFISLLQTYVDFSCNLFCVSVPTITYSCISGTITKTGTLAGVYVVPQAVDLTGGGTGVVAFASRTGSYPAGATDWLHVLLGQTPTTCYITNGNFNADPLFNDASNEDFTVPSTSPLIGKGTNGLNIGDVKVVNKVSTTASGWTFVNTSGSSDVISTSATYGIAQSPLLTANGLRSLGVTSVHNSLNFNVNVTAPATQNDQICIIRNYTKNGVGVTNSSPRPSKLIRWTTSSTAPTVDGSNSPTTPSQFINDNPAITGVLAGEWVCVALGQQAYIDANGYGNGDINFDPTTQVKINMTYYQEQYHIHRDLTV